MATETLRLASHCISGSLRSPQIRALNKIKRRPCSRQVSTRARPPRSKESHNKGLRAKEDSRQHSFPIEIDSTYQEPGLHCPNDQLRRLVRKGCWLKETCAVACTDTESAVLVLKRGKSRLFYSGSPIIYGGAVERIVAPRPPKTGDAMSVVDANGKAVCWGVFNKVSMYCLRVLQWQWETGFDDEKDVKKLLHHRIQAALALRKALNLPSSSTNVFRLVNSEGDRLSGLVVDVYGTVAVVSSTAAWTELHQDTIIQSLKASLSLEQVLWQSEASMLQLEGFPLQDSHGSGGGAARMTTHVTESGISYKVDLLQGQKTGFYADQRDSRALIASLCQQKEVLDLYCYTGGFSLAALAGGAKHVTGVDSSAAAIDLATENAALASDSTRVDFERQEVERFMSLAAKRRQMWDIVILDPPKLAPNRKAVEGASRKYEQLNAAALLLLKPGGLLMTCSCSGALTQSKGLLPLVQAAALRQGRKLTLLRSMGAGPDHPIDPAYPEGEYLTNLLFRVI